MNEQARRTYYEIIDYVGELLEKEGGAHDIDDELIASIRNDWHKNLESFQAESVANTADPMDFYERGGIDGSYSSDLSEEEQLDRLERHIGVYMVCYFTKVIKTKTKWKCHFTNGFINIGNCDIPYSIATGEFLQW